MGAWMLGRGDGLEVNRDVESQTARRFDELRRRYSSSITSSIHDRASDRGRSRGFGRRGDHPITTARSPSRPARYTLWRIIAIPDGGWTTVTIAAASTTTMIATAPSGIPHRVR